MRFSSLAKFNVLFEFTKSDKMITPLDSDFLASKDFKYIRPIGKCTNGTMHLVYSPQYKMHFSIKRTPIKSFRDSEVECMMEMKSIYVIQLYKYYNYKDSMYLVMEYCPTTIEELIASKQKFATEKQLDIALGLVLSVKSCHSSGIVHGDIKPSAFLQSSEGKIKIWDFGFACNPDKDYQMHKDYVPSIFTAPEILLGQDYNPFLADIWSLGVTLYYLFTGEYPWSLDSKEKMLENILCHKYDDSKIKDTFQKMIVDACLQIDPNARSSASDIGKMIKKRLSKSKCSIRPSASANITFQSLVSNTAKKSRRITVN